MPRWNASGALGYAGHWFGVLLLVAATGVSLFQTRKNVAMIAVTLVMLFAFAQYYEVAMEPVLRFMATGFFPGRRR